jgi:hypothetical protein
MNTTRIPTGTPSRAVGVSSGCAATASHGSSWEYKVAILAAGAAQSSSNVQQQFADGLGRQGWIFVGENRGILHFKRPKRASRQA